MWPDDVGYRGPIGHAGPACRGLSLTHLGSRRCIAAGENDGGLCGEQEVQYLSRDPNAPLCDFVEAKLGGQSASGYSAKRACSLVALNRYADLSAKAAAIRRAV